MNNTRLRKADQIAKTTPNSNNSRSNLKIQKSEVNEKKSRHIPRFVTNTENRNPKVKRIRKKKTRKERRRGIAHLRSQQ